MNRRQVVLPLVLRHQRVQSTVDGNRLAQDLGVVVLLGPVFDFCDNALLHNQGIDEIRRLAQFDNVCVNWAFLEFYLNGGNQIAKPRCKAVSSVVVVSPDDQLLLTVTCTMNG